MLPRTTNPRTPSLPAMALFLTLLAGAAIAATPVQVYTVTPSPAPADSVFTLFLHGGTWSCNAIFARDSVKVTDHRIDLSFVARADSAPCIYLRPIGYGPAFSMPALKAGTYEVWATQMEDCLYSPPSCGMAVQPQYAGTLIVGSDGTIQRVGWFLKEHVVTANKAFSMQLLNRDYGNCQTTFSHQTVSLQSSSIYTSFLVESHPAQVCLVDLRPWGPTFDMQALKPGIYPLYVSQLAQCEVTPPYCMIAIAPRLSDTLVVSQTLSILMSGLRRSPQVDLHGSRAAFLLPRDEGHGAWKVELLALSGQRLTSASVTGEGGQRAEVELGLKPERGVYLLRLSAPGGETHMLPVVRGD